MKELIEGVTSSLKEVAEAKNELTKALDAFGLGDVVRDIEQKIGSELKSLASELMSDTENTSGEQLTGEGVKSPQELPNNERYAEGVGQWHDAQERIEQPQDLSERPNEGGINSEGRTREELYARPYDYENLKDNVSTEKVEAGIDRTHQRLEQEPFTRGTIDGTQDFWGLRFDDFVVKLPSEAEYAAICKEKGIDPKNLDSATLRKINYEIVQSAFAEKYGCTLKEAENIIGNRLNGIIHEAKEGYAIIVPANIHNEKSAFAHSGYVSHIKNELTNK